MASSSVYAWGFGKSGELGNGNRVTQHTPQQVKFSKTKNMTKDEFVSISSGAAWSAFVTKDGKLYTCGCGKYGRLGDGSEQDSDIPTLVKHLSDVNIKQVSCGSWHGVALDTEGRVYTWGYSKSHGVLGRETSTPGSFDAPAIVTSLEGVHVVGVSSGNNFTLVWDDTGKAYSWGYGKNGVLGHGDQEDQHTPKQIMELSTHKVVHMSAGFARCAAISESGVIFTFGKGSDGALGLESSVRKDQCIPREVTSLEHVKILQISCSVGEHHGHMLALDEHGKVWSWGDGYKGKLGHGDQQSADEPREISRDYFNNEPVICVSAGGIHSSAVTREGNVYTWGCGSDGRLGHEDGKGHRYLFREDIPRKVEHLSKVGQAISVTASYYHTVALVTHNMDKVEMS